MQVPRHCASLLFLWSTLQLSTAHQFDVVVRILVSLTAFLILLCELSLDACVPHQRRTFLSSQASNQLSSADLEQHSPWRIVLSMTPTMHCTDSWLDSRMCKGILRSRRPFVPVAWKLLDSLSELDIRVKQWTKHKWNADYLESTSRVHAFIPRVNLRRCDGVVIRASSSQSVDQGFIP